MWWLLRGGQLLRAFEVFEAYLEGEEAYLEFLAQEGKKADEVLATARKKRRLG